ncbi:hypothetical protein GCM10010447_51360 [Streptomyces fulvorobeus]|uniref:hypothetical protein n=1 Tax=Streptomyces fulvorobeus TaxID=284028 RepID=UPI0031D27FBA
MTRTSRVLTVAAGTAALVAGATASASATTIIGFGNGTFYNSCNNLGNATPKGATTAGPGTLNALATALPYSGPTNLCGDLSGSLIKVDAPIGLYESAKFGE